MKKSIFTLIVLGTAALLFSAAAQTPSPGPNNTPPGAVPNQPAPPPGMGNDNGGPPPDMGGQPPPDMNADQTAPDQSASEAAAGQPSAQPVSPGSAPRPRYGTNRVVILPTRAIGADQGKTPSAFMPPETAGTNSNELRLNFRNAPLDMVLNYLSDAAGFIIVLDTQVRGNISVISSHPMTKDEAVDLLNAALNQNGYAAIRDGRTLTIVNKSDAKTRDIPVKVGNDPAAIPNNDEIVTQIIPVRFIEAQQLVSDLSAFVSPQATVVANQAANSIVVTDTQANIRHLVRIIRSVDDSAEAETQIRVFPLKYANPTDVANELSSIFPNSSSGNNSQAPIRFGGRGGFFARMMASRGNNNSSSSDRIQKATQVTAVADARLQAVIVSAPKDLMEQIADMMKDLDVPSPRDQNVYVFKVRNGDSQQIAQELQNMFQSSSSSRGNNNNNASSQNSALQQRQQTTVQTSGSTTSTTSGMGGNNAGGYGGAGGGGRQF